MTRLHPDDVEAIAAAVARLLRDPASSPIPIAEPDRDRAAERLVFALHIYGGYSINSRGPSGCLIDAIDAIAPEVGQELRDHDADEVYKRRWAEDDE